MKVLLTGAAGFLGSHLSQRLIDDGHNVIALDDLSTGSLVNIEHLMRHPNFRFVEHDVRKPYSTDIDAILNFACPASPIHYQLDPVRTIETNFLGIINLLRLAKESGAIILQASTSEVYGDPTESPQKETYWGNVNPIGIRACYDEGKRAAETLFFDYNRQYGVEIKVARIFNTYGPRMDLLDGRVVSNFIVQALQNKPISIYGDGSQTRSFCYVSDLIDGFLKFLYAKKELTGPMNIGNPNEFTILELAQLVIQLTKSNSVIEHLPLPSDDPKQRRPDITMVTEKLGWKPTVELKEGLLKTISDFQTRLQK